MPASTAPVSEVDLFDDDVLVDPYPIYGALREIGGVVHLPANEAFVLTRYEVIREVLADWETFSSEEAIGFNPAVNEKLKGTTLASDPPRHTELRAALTANLSPRALRGLKASIEAKCDALVTELVQKGSFDAIDSLVRAVPLEVVADLIGFTGHVRDNMLRWGQAAMQVIGPMSQRTAEAFPIAGELYEWCSTVTAGDLTPGSVGRGIFDAEARGEIPPGAAGPIIHQYLGAGVDTTIAAIGNVIALFAAHPDQLALVRERPSLVASAFNEVLRYWAPLHVWGRRATREVEIDGVVIPSGAKIAILFGAGNRDPRHYDEPDAFLVERNPVDHLSFGYGVHGCAGQGLARLEAHAVIGALSRRVERLHVGPEVRVPSQRVVRREPVAGQSTRPPLRRDRQQVHDARGPVVRHRAERFLNQQERCFHVDRYDEVPFLGGYLEERLLLSRRLRGDPDRVDQCGQRADRDRRVHRFAVRPRGREISCDRDVPLAASGRQRRGNALGRFLVRVAVIVSAGATSCS